MQSPISAQSAAQQGPRERSSPNAAATFNAPKQPGNPASQRSSARHKLLSQAQNARSLYPETTPRTRRKHQIPIEFAATSNHNRKRFRAVALLRHLTSQRADSSANQASEKPAQMLQLLRRWWKVRSRRDDAGVAPEDRWLFPGRDRGRHLTARQFSPPVP